MNLYYQDESRFGLKTHVGRCLTAKGVKPIVTIQHQFKNTYLYGAYSPIDGDSYVWEAQNVNKNIFHKYLTELSAHKPDEFKIIIVDNARFHSVKDFTVPNNIILINIPPYSPELNPCEQIWQYIKQRFKNQLFHDLEQLKSWLEEQVKAMKPEIIQSIVSNHLFLNAFNATF